MATLNGRSDGVVPGQLAHRGSTLGLYGVTPATRPTAYTQTYSTATKTHSNPTAANPAAITEYTPHASGAVPVVSAGATDLDTTAAALNTLVDECQALETEVSALVVDMANVKQVLNQVLDDLQTVGMLQ